MKWAVLLLFSSSCAMSLTDARKHQAEVEAGNEPAYREALAQAGLQPAEPPGDIITFGGPMGVGRADQENHQELVIGYWNEADRDPPEHASFARDQQGRLWLIERRPEVLSTESITAKGCYSGYNKGIPPAEYPIGYLLPPDVRVAGTKEIRYPVRRVTIHRADGRCYKGPPVP